MLSRRQAGSAPKLHLRVNPNPMEIGAVLCLKDRHNATIPVAGKELTTTRMVDLSLRGKEPIDAAALKPLPNSNEYMDLRVNIETELQGIVGRDAALHARQRQTDCLAQGPRL